jgi:2-polyprenyl-3-methyl-5-hydroxy-6-metoxy-1,4-benzoquinol methylase
VGAEGEDGMRGLARERARLFDREAEGYDLHRPRYPAEVVDAVLGPDPAGLDVLDVGCGTGIATRPMADRGARVLGVEAAPGMAAVALGPAVEERLLAAIGAAIDAHGGTTTLHFETVLVTADRRHPGGSTFRARRT